MDRLTPPRVATYALAGMLAATLLVFWPTSLAAFAPYKTFALCVLAAVAAVALAVKGVPGAPRVLVALWATVAVVLAASAALGVDPWRSFRGTFPRYESLAVLLVATSLVWLIPAVTDRKGLATIIEILFGATAIAGAYGVTQYAGVDPLNLVQGGRAWSTVGNPVHLGNAMALLTPLPLVVTLTGRGTAWMRRLAPFAAALGAAACLVSLTRGAWIGLLVGSLVAVALAWRHIERDRALAVAAAIAVAFLLLVALPGPRDALSDRVASIRPDSPSMKARLLKWELGVGMLADRPLLGWGWDSVSSTYPSRVPEDWLARDPEGIVTDRLHADWLDIAVASGLAGLAAILALLAASVVGGRPILVTQGTGRVLGAGLLGGIVAYLVASLTGFPAVATWPLFWGSVGLFVTAGLSVPDLQTPAGGLPVRATPARGGPQTTRILAAVLAAIALVGAAWAIQDIRADRALFAAAMTPGEQQAMAYGIAAAGFPNDAYVQLRVSNGLLNLGRASSSVPILAEAERPARRALELRPDDPAAKTTLADVILAQGLRGESDRLTEASDLYAEVLEAAPYRPDTLKNGGLAEYAQQTTESVKNAVALWSIAWSVDSLDPDAALNLALAYDWLGQSEDAMEWASVAAALAPERQDIRQLVERLATRKEASGETAP